MTPSRFVREIVELAADQKWSCRTSGNGLLFAPPHGKAKAGHTTVHLEDPGNDSGSQKAYRRRFEQAGLIFEEKHLAMTEQKLNGGARATSVIPVKGPATRYASIREKINLAATALAEAEQLVNEIETESRDLVAMREAFRKTLGM